MRMQIWWRTWCVAAQVHSHPRLLRRWARPGMEDVRAEVKAGEAEQETQQETQQEQDRGRGRA